MCVGCGGKEDIDEGEGGGGGVQRWEGFCPLYLGGSQVSIYA